MMRQYSVAVIIDVVAKLLGKYVTTIYFDNSPQSPV
jgi:hypothetical protein